MTEIDRDRWKLPEIECTKCAKCMLEVTKRKQECTKYTLEVTKCELECTLECTKYTLDHTTIQERQRQIDRDRWRNR